MLIEKKTSEQDSNLYYAIPLGEERQVKNVIDG